MAKYRNINNANAAIDQWEKDYNRVLGLWEREMERTKVLEDALWSVTRRAVDGVYCCLCSEVTNKHHEMCPVLAATKVLENH